MRWLFSPNAEIIDRPNQAFAEVMLPDSIDDDARDERSRAMLHVRHPFSKRAPLLSRIVPSPLAAGRVPVILRGFAAQQHAHETKPKRLLLRVKVATIEQPGLARFRTIVRKC